GCVRSGAARRVLTSGRLRVGASAIAGRRRRAARASDETSDDEPRRTTDGSPPRRSNHRRRSYRTLVASRARQSAASDARRSACQDVIPAQPLSVSSARPIRASTKPLMNLRGTGPAMGSVNGGARMDNGTRNNQRGFTLLEIMIVIALIGLLL